MTAQNALAIVFASLLIVGVLYAGLAPPNGPSAASPAAPTTAPAVEPLGISAPGAVPARGAPGDRP
jgi:hypothetical protein